MNEARDRFFVVDDRTGEPILPAEERATAEAEARWAAEERATVAEERAEAMVAELARLRAELARTKSGTSE